MKYIKHKIISRFKSNTDKKKLLHVYISLIIDHNSNNLLFKQIQEKLKQDFNYLANLKDISNYFEPNFKENIQDIELLVNNLNIRYD